MYSAVNPLIISQIYTILVKTKDQDLVIPTVFFLLLDKKKETYGLMLESLRDRIPRDGPKIFHQRYLPWNQDLLLSFPLALGHQAEHCYSVLTHCKLPKITVHQVTLYSGKQRNPCGTLWEGGGHLHWLGPALQYLPVTV